MSYPSFSLDHQRFDQSTYSGRLRRCFDVVDPTTLFVTKGKLASSLKLLDDFENSIRAPTTTDAQLWKARKVKEVKKIIFQGKIDKVRLLDRMVEELLSMLRETTKSYNTSRHRRKNIYTIQNVRLCTIWHC